MTSSTKHNETSKEEMRKEEQQQNMPIVTNKKKREARDSRINKYRVSYKQNHLSKTPIFNHMAINGQVALCIA